MRNTDYNIDVVGGILSSEASFDALMGMISDLGLEVTAVKKP